jgi:hypothetical protein
MKGILLSSLYTSKKSLILYFFIGIVASIFFSFSNPMMACFMPMICLISPVTDNIKHEKDSRWMYYVSTLPSGRKAYVNSYFTFYTVLTSIGLIVGFVVVSIITQSLNLAFMSALVGIGAAGTYAIVLPLTFKFGPDNSNAIFVVTTIVVMLLFFAVFFGFVMPNMNDTMSGTENVTRQFMITGVYGLIGILALIISYALSLNIFKKQDL